MDRLLKVATPPTAATVFVPLRVPPPGLVPMATVTCELLPRPRLLNWPSTCTAPAGRRIRPAWVLLGCTPKTTLAAAAGVMLKKADVAAIRLASVADRV